jgi:hypothetical protein
MDYILHLGDTKTGSTSIQQSLFEMREPLAGRGVLYCVPQGKESHLVYARVVSGKQKTRDAERGKRRSGKEASIVAANRREIGELVASGRFTHSIYSGEGYLISGPQQVARIVEFVEAQRDGFHAIAYIRSPESMYLSSVQQGLKRRDKVRPPDDFFHPYVQSIDNWASHPACRSFTLRHFDRARLVDGSVVRDFQNVLSQFFDFGGLSLPEKHANESLSAEQMIVLQEYRRLLADGRQARGGESLSRLVRLFQTMYADHKRNGGGPIAHTRPELDPDIAAMIRGNHARESEALLARFPHIDFRGAGAAPPPRRHGKQWGRNPLVASILATFSAEGAELLRRLLPEHNPGLRDRATRASLAAHAAFCREALRSREAWQRYLSFLAGRQCVKLASFLENEGEFDMSDNPESPADKPEKGEKARLPKGSDAAKRAKKIRMRMKELRAELKTLKQELKQLKNQDAA